MPGLSNIPVIGRPMFDQNVIVYAMYVVIVARHRAVPDPLGSRTRAVGEHPKAADTVGIRVLRFRYVTWSSAGWSPVWPART